MLLRFLVGGDASHLKLAALNEQPMAGLHDELVRIEQAFSDGGDGLSVSDWILVRQDEDDDEQDGGHVCRPTTKQKTLPCGDAQTCVLPSGLSLASSWSCSTLWAGTIIQRPVSRCLNHQFPPRN